MNYHKHRLLNIMFSLSIQFYFVFLSSVITFLYSCGNGSRRTIFIQKQDTSNKGHRVIRDTEKLGTPIHWGHIYIKDTEIVGTSHHNFLIKGWREFEA